MIDPGTEFEGRYRIVRLLGEGAMGAVYEAEHTVVGRRVAIKVLHAHFARVPEAIKRFSREARAAAEIGHENIVEVFDVGTHEGSAYLVMELLRGETLGERLAHTTALDTREACSIIGHVLSALASTHAKGIVHRDLKPDNVFLVERSGESIVKLLDFGVSKFRRSGETIHETTQEGLPIGTPAYMAPEQWMGRRDIDHRADLFAAGVMLYELLTGGMPFEGASQGELFLEIVRGTDPPPAPSTIAPGVPEAIDAVVLRALRREREQRYPSARAFLDALRPFGADAITVVDLPPAPVTEESPITLPRRGSRDQTLRVESVMRPTRFGPWGLGFLFLAVLGLVANRVWTRLAPHPAPSMTGALTAIPRAAVVTSRTVQRPDDGVVDAAPVPAAAPSSVLPLAPSTRASASRARTTTSARRERPGVGALRISHEF